MTKQDARRLLVIHNPAAGRRKAAFVAAVIVALSQCGLCGRVRETGARGDAERFAPQRRPRHPCVVAAGGDGTVNEVINGLYARAHDDRPPALGIIPLGTVNVLARELGLPLEIAGVARMLAQGRTVPLYAGLANGRRFALMAGVGFDARVVARVDPRLKRGIGRGAYAFGILRELISGGPARFSVSIDGGTSVEAAAVIVANGRLYAGSYELASDASVREPTLHVCLFEHGGRLDVARYLFTIASGRIAQAKGFRIVAGCHVTITAPENEPAQGDGDTLTMLPVSISAADAALAVIAVSSCVVPAKQRESGSNQ